MKVSQRLRNAATKMCAVAAQRIRQFFCKHELVTKVDKRANVRNDKEEITCTVRLTWLRCKKCSRDYVYASDKRPVSAAEAERAAVAKLCGDGDVEIHFSEN